MLAREGDLQQHDDVYDYQRHREGDNLAERWDEQQGEFISAPVAPVRRAIWRTSGPDVGYLPDVWHEARQSAVNTALAPIRAARG